VAEVEIHGMKYTLVGPSEFNLGELNDGENLFGASFGDEEVNSRKLSAILYTTIKRVNPAVSAADIRKLTPEDLEAIHQALLKWQSESEEDDGKDIPPPEGSNAEHAVPESSTNGSSNSPETESESDPSPTGEETSPTGSTSGRLTSAN
jgi:hypothetical protein